MISAYMSGDAGDAVAGLVAIRQLGGSADVIIGPHVGTGGPRELMTQRRADFILPLIAAQSYVNSARFAEKKSVTITHDLSTFREKCPVIRGESLAHWHGRHVGIRPSQLDVSPWLTVKPANESDGRVVVARSPRYHHPKFPWKRVVQKFGPWILFVGLPSEHATFCDLFGKVTYRPVTDALEMASLIAGSYRFYGNQSLPCWIAMGLGHPLTQETFPQAPNSILRRHNTEFFG